MSDSNYWYESELTTEEFRKIPDGFRLTAKIVYEDGQWTALALDFDIAGRADTPFEAAADMMGLVEEYLSYGFAEGRTFRQMVRPVPRLVWLRASGSMSLRALRRGRLPRHDGSRRSIYREEPFLPGRAEHPSRFAPAG